MRRDRREGTEVAEPACPARGQACPAQPTPCALHQPPANLLHVVLIHIQDGSIVV